MAHFTLTIISLPYNAGIAAQTTNVTLKTGTRDTPSPERLKRELRSGSAGWEFQPMLRKSLAASADILSSVIAFITVEEYYLQNTGDVKGLLLDIPPCLK
jgi:hypothetical protein